MTGAKWLRLSDPCCLCHPQPLSLGGLDIGQSGDTATSSSIPSSQPPSHHCNAVFALSMCLHDAWMAIHRTMPYSGGAYSHWLNKRSHIVQCITLVTSRIADNRKLRYWIVQYRYQHRCYLRRYPSIRYTNIGGPSIGYWVAFLVSF